MFPTSQSCHGNQYAIDRRSHRVVDLDYFVEKRWPAECLHLHKYSCPKGYDEGRFRAHRPRQVGPVEADGVWDFLTRLGRAGRRESA